MSLAHSWSSEVIFSSASTEGAAALRREQTKAEKYSMERLPGEEAVRLVPLVLEHFDIGDNRQKNTCISCLSGLLTSVETATAHSLRLTGENVCLFYYRDATRE